MSTPDGLVKHTTRRTSPIDIKNAWKRIESGIKSIAPTLAGNLATGADSARIAEFENTIKRSLPQSVRDSFMTYDGESGTYKSPIFNGFQFLSLAKARKIWEGWRFVDDETDLQEAAVENGSGYPADTIKLGYSNPNWIPIAEIDDVSCFGIDLDPGPAGIVGQVINFGRDEEVKVVLAWSWGMFLSDIADEMERGNFRLTDKEPDRGLMLVNPRPTYGNFYNIMRAWAEAKLGGNAKSAISNKGGDASK